MTNNKRHLVKPLHACFLIVGVVLFILVYISLTYDASPASSKPKLRPVSRPPALPIEPFRSRNDLAAYLEQQGFTVGAEIGVQLGLFAEWNLRNWPSCTKYILVDTWQRMPNYEDAANYDDAKQDYIYQEALRRLNPYQSKLQICRNFSISCALQFPDEFFDFIYLDARHDRKGLSEDLAAYWPKLKYGGIFAGHDFVTQEEVGPEQDWTKNYDGSVDTTGQVARGAVVDFFSDSSSDHMRQIAVSYRESNWNSWAVRK